VVFMRNEVEEVTETPVELFITTPSTIPVQVGAATPSTISVQAGAATPSTIPVQVDATTPSTIPVQVGAAQLAGNVELYKWSIRLVLNAGYAGYINCIL